MRKLLNDWEEDARLADWRAVAANAWLRSRRCSTTSGSADCSSRDLDLRGLLRRLDLLFHGLESGSEHGSGQLGYVAAIADSGFDAVLDQLLLQFYELRLAFQWKVPESRQSDSWRS
jgi:hypothetical protein